MRVYRAIRGLTKSEAGSFMGTAIFLSVIIAVIAIIIIDGSSVFYANAASGDVSQDAANLALEDYRLTKSDISAENAAADYCESKELVFINFEVSSQRSHIFNVTCGKDAKTYVFKYLPYLKGMIHQEETRASAVY